MEPYSLPMDKFVVILMLAVWFCGAISFPIVIQRKFSWKMVGLAGVWYALLIPGFWLAGIITG